MYPWFAPKKPIELFAQATSPEKGLGETLWDKEIKTNLTKRKSEKRSAKHISNYSNFNVSDCIYD